jgi:P-type Mg2+ transporter
VAPPAFFFLILVVMLLFYLLAVEGMKQWFFRRFAAERSGRAFNAGHG